MSFSLSPIPSFQARIVKAIQNFAKKSAAAGAKKLTGRPAWRIRIGDYRVIYEIHDDRLLVIIVVVGNRKDVYG